jgi:hypothetical protein
MGGERHSFYRQIHKGIRAVAHGLVEQAGRTDFLDAGEVASLRASVEAAFGVFESHAAHETKFITPLLRVCAPHLAAESEADHRAQDLRLRDLRSALNLAAGGGAAAAAMGQAFVVGLSRFEGEMLVHMADEEERLMPALWAVFDDAALQRVHEALLASLSPAEKTEVLGWMLPALSAPERTELLTGVRKTAPPEVFAAVEGVARRVLAPPDWSRLEQSLAVAA